MGSKKKLIKWGIPMLLSTICLMTNTENTTVEASKGVSHIGTFNGSTTFTTSSSNGINPGLFIEVMDDYGNLTQYESEDGVITIPNTKEGAYITQAKLLGKTKYMDQNTGEVLDDWEESRNLKLESSKMPVLTTIGSNLAKESYVINPFYSNLGMTHLSEIDDCISPGTTFYIKGYNIPTTINLMIVEYEGKNSLKKSWSSLAKDRTIKYTVANENCNLIKIVHDENCIVKYGEDVFYTVKMMVSLNENLPTTNHDPIKQTF